MSNKGFKPTPGQRRQMKRQGKIMLPPGMQKNYPPVEPWVMRVRPILAPEVLLWKRTEETDAAIRAYASLSPDNKYEAVLKSLPETVKPLFEEYFKYATKAEAGIIALLQANNPPELEAQVIVETDEKILFLQVESINYRIKYDQKLVFYEVYLDVANHGLIIHTMYTEANGPDTWEPVGMFKNHPIVGDLEEE